MEIHMEEKQQYPFCARHTVSVLVIVIEWCLELQNKK